MYLYDQSFHKKLEAENIRMLIMNKVQEQIYVLKNIFGEERNYDYQMKEEEVYDEEYTRAKRTIKNTSALKRLNNLALTEEITL